MKLVVTGTPGESRCSTSRSTTKLSSSWSEEKRAKSSCWVGLAWVGADARRQHLLEVVVALGPERRAPGVVEPRHVVVVPAAQPRAERRRADVAVAAGVVAAELVGHVPQRERRVVAVALGHPGAQLQGVLAVDRRAGAEGLAPAGPQRAPVLGRPAASRGGGASATAAVRRWRWRGRRGSPPRAGRPSARRASRSPTRPARAAASAHEKTAERDQVDAGLAHQARSSTWAVGAATARGCSRRRRRARAGKSACATVSTLTRESQRSDEDLGLEMFDLVRMTARKG